MNRLLNPHITRIVTDPHGVMARQGCSPEDVPNMLGLLPMWASVYLPETDLLRTHMEESYGFPLSYDSAATMDENNVLHYPGDDPLHPLYIMEFDSGQKMVIYPYGLVMFVDFCEAPINGPLQQFFTRMD